MKKMKSPIMVIIGSLSVMLILPVIFPVSGVFGQTASFDNWKKSIFGQSVAPNKNSVTIDPVNKTATIVAGDKDGETGGGKMASSHDGISYFYQEVDSTKNFVLTAKVKVNFFAKDQPDKQEAFGIMARDAVNKDNDSSVFASNMVMVGGYRGFLGSVMRNYVKDASGAGAKMEDAVNMGARPANDGSSVYTMTMKKTNTGYHVSIDNGTEKIYYRPKLLEVINPSKVYVGFFAARIASITVSDIKFSTSDVATDPAGLPEPKVEEPTEVLLNSPAGSPYQDYAFKLSINKPGNLEVKLNGKTRFYGPIAKAGLFERTYTLDKGYNTFYVLFTPAAGLTGEIAEFEKMIVYRSYGKENGEIYVSQDGVEASDGTLQDPVDINSAIKFSRPGQTIVLTGGKYQIFSRIVIEKGNDGLPDKPKTIMAMKGKKIVLDLGGTTDSFLVNGNYWKLYGFDITHSKNNGIKMPGSHNIIERVNTYENGDTGMQISGWNTDPKELWPSYDLILNCTSYDNLDVSENNADGFAAKLTCGAGNVFRGCISHNNCDDGWDLYSKLDTGPIGAITIENCVSYGNGILSNGRVTKGDGNGFKLGGEGLAVKHVLRNSLSFKNKSAGITNNSDPAVIVENCTSVDNGTTNFQFSVYSKVVPQFVVTDCISFRTKSGATDVVLDSMKNTNNYFVKNAISSNSEGKQASASDFLSTTPAPFTISDDGMFSIDKFMVPAPASSLKGGAKLNDFTKATIIPVK